MILRSIYCVCHNAYSCLQFKVECPLRPAVGGEFGEREGLADTGFAPTRFSLIGKSDLSQVFRQVDRLMEGSDSDRYNAYSILLAKSKDRQPMTYADFLWRFAKATYLVSELEAKGNRAKKKSLVYKAKDLAGMAMQIDDGNAETHKWWAVTLGSVGEIEGKRAQIENGYRFKKHIEKSIELNPNDPAAHHLMGRWCYGVSMLSWTKRKAAAVLLSDPPTASIDDALRHFMDAERLNPGRWKENLLYLGKCFIEKKEYRKAVLWLEKGHRLPVKNSIDAVNQTEIEDLLTQYRGYHV